MEFVEKRRLNMPKRRSEELLKENARIHKNTMEFFKERREIKKQKEAQINGMGITHNN